jgi:hypothetical protein
MLVDESDYDVLNQWAWSANKTRSGFRARRSERVNGKVVRTDMARYITNAPQGTEVDHENGNTLDNRKQNLRIATRKQNAANTAVPRHNTSGFKGVSFHKDSGLWRAVCGEQYAGCHATAREAALAYDKLAVALYGQFAWLNFPGDTTL